MKKHWLKIEVLLICVLWLGLTVASWLKPADEFSLAERRPLEQMPEVTAENILDGNFMTKFEDYTLCIQPGWRLVRFGIAYQLHVQL